MEPTSPLCRRQPLFWAALAFAGGIFAGAQAWRPPLWWVVASVAFLGAALYFLRGRLRPATALALGALALLGALGVQIRDAAAAPNQLARFCDQGEGLVTAYVLRDGVLRSGAFGGVQQAVDVETEEIAPAGGEAARVAAGIRLAIFYSPEDEEDTAGSSAPRLLLYGQRLRFRAKLRPPRNYGNPGAMDARAYLAGQGIRATASTKAETVEALPGSGGSRLGRLQARVRRSLLARMDALWGKQDAPLLAAMLIGERSLIDRETRQNFQRTGAYHILVVSGLNVGLLAFPVFWVLRRLRANEVLSTVVTVVVTGGYAWLTDLGAPILRATLMLWIYLGARLLYRDARAPMNAIGAAGLALLVVNPRDLFDPSFQMTFLCVLAIAGIGLPLLERTSEGYRRALTYLDSTDYDLHLEPRLAQFRLDLRLIVGRLARLLPARSARGGILWAAPHAGRAVLAGFDVLLISVLMQFAMVLPMAVYAHRAALLTVPANAVVVPLTGVLTPVALLATVLSYLSEALAYLPALVTRLALHGITASVRFLGGIRTADLRVATPAPLVILAAATGFALAMLAARRRRIFALAGLAAMVVSAAWVAAVPPRMQLRPGVLEVTALDVGQGDSLLVVSPQGKTLLVDAGGLPGQARSRFDLGEDVVSPYLWSRGIVRLDAVALSHAHADHMGGMRSVIANFRPRELWIGVIPHSQPLRELLQQASEQGLAVKQYAAGSRFDFGGAVVEVFSPPQDWKIGRRAQNNDSLVLRLSYEGRSALLEGDAERRMERLLSPRHPQADVLKVGHHGSANSTSAEFLAQVQPRYAVISAGPRNAFGYPRREVLARLEESHVATFRTDVHGAVTFYLGRTGVEAKLPNRR